MTTKQIEPKTETEATETPKAPAKPKAKAAKKPKAAKVSLLPKLDDASFIQGQLPLDLIQTGKIQNSRSGAVDTEDLEASIAELGLETALVVWEQPGKKKGSVDYHLISGFRRLQAVKNIRQEDPSVFKTVPVSIFQGSEDDAVLHNLSENAQRSNPNAVDYGAAIERLKDATGWSYTEIAQKMGKHKSWATTCAKLHKGPAEGVTKELRKAVQTGLIGFGMAKVVSTKKADVQLDYVKACEKALQDGTKKPGTAEVKKLEEEHGGGEKPIRQTSRKIKEVLVMLEEVRTTNVDELKASAVKLRQYLTDSKKHPLTMRELEENLQNAMKISQLYGQWKALEWASGVEIDWEAPQPPFAAGPGKIAKPEPEEQPAKAKPAPKPKAKGKKAAKPAPAE